ncbi:hypothetical protein FM076_26450 [Streptomyces albus subsp. chlorinus]|uniref:hypothetical protein n=1 Tax=Streptomyces albus TaxID=1888 RepID=UPI00156E8940|nr:hypothetical protein [Streptomyces albus]NSC24501.1 hypothetical protein [Streptomyces albus subsp. chlorinus]
MPRKHGFGRAVLIGTVTLMCACAALWVFASAAFTNPSDPGGLAFGVVMLVVGAPLVAAGCLVATVCLALPALVLAELARREPWPWVLLSALVVAAGPFGPWTAFEGGWPVSVGVWLAAAGALGATALSARAARRQVAAVGAWRALGRTLCRGAVACLAALVLGFAVHGVALAAGLY